MNGTLLTDIDAFLNRTGLTEYRFGWLAVRNGRLVERLRDGRRIWPDTEMKVRAWMRSQEDKAA